MTYGEIYDTAIDEQCAQRMIHALGIDIQIKNKRSKYAECSRNYFLGKDDEVQHLCDIGFMKELRHDCSVVTKAGVLWLENAFNKVIKFRDFEDVYE